MLELIEKIAPESHNVLSTLALKAIKISSFEGRRESKYLNFVTTRLLPADPLRNGTKQIPTTIICAPKDLEILPYSIMSVKKNFSGTEQLTVLVPETIKVDVQTILEHLNVEAKILVDEELMESYLGDKKLIIEKAARMQFLKLLSVIFLENKESLVVDGDTIYLKQRTWIAGKKISFPVSQEFLPRHTRFSRRRLGLLSNSGLGFITHHQVVCKDCVKEIILRTGGVESFARVIQAVFSKTENWHDEFPSEWQFLGDFMMESNMHEVVPVRFANIGIDRKVIKLEFGQELDATNILIELENLARLVPALYSISLHSYK